MKPYIFIHINKCGGTSVKRALNWPYDGKVQKHRHETAEMIRFRLNWEQWENRYKFAVIRNPFARLVSSYFFRQTIARYKRVIKDASFEYWFERTIIEQDKRWVDNPLMYKPFSYWIKVDGQVVVDVYKLEEINDWWPDLMNRLDCDSGLPHLNGTEHDPWQEFITPEIEKEIRSCYREDLAYYPEL